MSGMGGGWGNLALGFYQGQDSAIEREIRRDELKRQKLKDQQDEKTRAGMGAGIEALGQLQPPPQMPPQGAQPPQPGQSSQPMRPPGMPPGMPPGGGMPPPPGAGAPPQQRPQMQMPPSPFAGPPPQLGAPGGRPPLPPYQGPQPPQQPQPQGGQGIPPPPGQQPQQGMQMQPDLPTLMRKLTSQGMDAETAFQVANRFEPMLSMQGKAQLAMANAEIHRLHAERADATAAKRADTGEAGEKRRGETAAGTNEYGKAKVFQMTASGEAALERAHKYKGGGSGGSIPSSSDIDGMAEAVAAYKLDPRMLSIKGGYREKVLERALKLNPDYDSKNYAAENAGATSAARVAGTSAGRTAIAADAALGGLDILLEQSKKVERTAFPRINKALLGAKTEAGIPEVGAFEAAINTAVNEYARAVSPVGQPTVSDKNHAREILASADSAETLAAKVAVLRKEITRAKKAPTNVQNELRDARGGQPKAKPTQADRDYVKAHPETAAQFKAHFGIDP